MTPKQIHPPPAPSGAEHSELDKSHPWLVFVAAAAAFFILAPTCRASNPARTPRPKAESAGVMVSATDSIFGAGHSVAPAPGGGSGGTLPPSHALPAGAGPGFHLRDAC